jgi:ankyrin repeat protein
MLCSIQATPYQREVTIILQMLLWSNQRLTLEACNDAVIVQPDRNPAFSVDDRFFDPLDVVKICSGLVTTVWSNTDFINFQYLQLAHASVREYLSSQEVIQPFQSHLREEDAWVYLIRLCHAYLCCIDWSTMDNQPDEFDQTFPLADWAVSAWPKHARYLEAFDDDVLASVLDFLQRACLVSEHLFRYSITQFYWADRTQCYPLYFAALMGFRRSCKRLIGSGSPDMPEESDESRGCVQRYSRLTELGVRPAAIQEDLDASLLAASARGYDIIVQDLLGRGARPDASRIQNYSDEYTALQLASRLGHTKVVQLLLESGASVNYNAKPLYKTPLYEASESGNVDVVDVLLAHKADPDLRSNGESPLRVAVLNGHVAVAQALISAGADRSNHFVHRFVKPSHERPGVVYYRGSDGKLIDTLLKLAVSRDDDNMVQLLLDNGFSTDDANVHAETVLHLAALWCEHTTIRMLLERGARIDTQGPEGTALAVASRSGRSHAVQILLNYEADLSGCRWHDPILAAAQKGHFGIVEQILVHDVHINELCYLGTALYRAAWQNSETLVKILLKHGAVADYHEESTRTPLQIATAGGHLEVMRLLIEGGASADQDGWPDFPPLHDPRVAFSRITTDRAWLRWLQTHPGSTLRQAGQRGPREAAELLSRALNPLQIAIIEGSPKAVELLLHCGADVNKGQWYTPLQIAVSLGHQDIVKKLLGSGAYLNISDPNATLLELAFRQNHEETVRLLVEHGAAVGGDDPLQLAALYGHVRTMQVLLAGRIIGNMDPPLAPRADFITERQLGSTLNIAVFADTYGYGRVEGYDHLGVVRLLLDQGFLNKCDWIPALHHVVEQGYTRYLHLFLEHGVDVNESYAYYWRANTADTPRFTSFKLLRVAAFHGHERTVRLLLHCGAEIDDSSQGNCALASAAAGKQEHMMQLLVKRDANIALAIQVAWGWTNSKKITRRLRRLQSSATSPPDHFPEWQEHEPLSLLDECYLQPPQEQAIFESRHGPSILVEDHDEIPSQVPIRSASSRRRSKISSTVSRLRSRLSRN